MRKQNSYKKPQDKLDELLEQKPIEEVAGVEEKVEEIPEIPQEQPKAKLYTVKVTHPSLRRREGPSLQAKQVGAIQDMGEYDVFAEVNGWGQLDNGDWIMLTYTKIVGI